MPTVDISDIRLHYRIDGSGPPLVLIAGMLSDGASWAPVLPALAARFTVIRPDNRTTGQTRPAEAPAGLAEWAGDVAALLDHLGIARAHVAGHSLGGMIALHLAAQAPDRVDRLALLASSPMRLSRTVALFRHLLALRGEGMPPDLWLRGLFPWLFSPQVYDDPAAVDAAVAQSLAYPHTPTPAAMARQVAALERVPELLTLPDPAPPTLAILGGGDLLLPPEPARAGLAGLAGLRVVELPGAGHSVHWDAPQDVVAHLIDHFGATP